MTVQKMTTKKIFSKLKSDLKLCIRFIQMRKPEYVKLYFGTDNRQEIADKLEVICKPFSDYQKADIENVISELHSYFIIKKSERWLKNKSKKNSKTK